jgi:hypothetical protein
MPACSPGVHLREVAVEVAAAVFHGSGVLDSSDEQGSASKGACVPRHTASAATPVLLLLLILLLLLFLVRIQGTDMLRLCARVLYTVYTPRYC